MRCSSQIRGRTGLALVFAIVVLAARPAAAQLVAPVFGAATPAGALNAVNTQFPTQLLPGNLEVEINQFGSDNLFKLASATRATPASPFSAPTQNPFATLNASFSDLRSGVVSPSGLELFFSVGYTPSHIYRATRADTASPFANPIAMPALEHAGTLHFVTDISSDGLRLYTWDGLFGGAFLFTRPTVASSFGAGSAAPFIQLPTAIENYDLTPDELDIYYTYGGALWWSRRAGTSQPFPAGVQITSILGALSEFDGQIIYYQRGDGLIMQAPLITPGSGSVPEPTAITLLLLASTIPLITRRRRC